MLRSLTGLRGIAAYSVLIAHGIAMILSGSGPIGAFASRLAWFGMTLFFVLSGFVIYYNYADAFQREPLPAATFRFFAHRFARIYPLYFISLVIVAIQTPAILANVTPLVALAHLTLTQSWLNQEMAIFPPSWSISTEWFFYVTFIPIAFVVARIRKPFRAMAIFSAVSLLVISPLLRQEFIVAHFTSILVHGPASTDAWSWFDYFNPYLRVLEFIIGALAARAYALRSPQPRHVHIMVYASAAWCLVAVLTSFLTTGWLIDIAPSFLNAPAIAILLYSSASAVTPVSRLLGSKILVFCGTISYSVYVWSWVVIPLVRTYVQFPLAPAYDAAILQIAMAALATTLAAFVSYQVIEQPSRRGLRRLFDTVSIAKERAPVTP